MANSFSNRMWIIDTAASTMVTDEPVYVKRVRWDDEGGAAGDNAIIQDAASKVLWASTEAGANYVESDLIERWWYNGFKVPTLGGGILYIELL